jgi:hypothetical protein
MNPCEHVYCTSCIHGEENLKRIDDNCEPEDSESCDKNCPCYGCYCYYPVDSQPFEVRPKYIKK